MDFLGTDTVNALRSIVTLLAFIVFIGIVVWAWSGARRKRFAEAARIPFDEEGVQSKSATQGSNSAEKSMTEKSRSEQTGTERSSQ